VESGQIVYFDNKDGATRIAPEHVVASGSLPPGFPPIQIGNRLYWDGACVSNTPLQAVLDDQPKGHVVIFMIDLWNAEGRAPQTIEDVALRQKQIQYASRTEHDIDMAATKLDLRQSLRSQDQAGKADGSLAANGADRVDIVHIIHKVADGELASSDAEFSRSSIQQRRQEGYADLRRALGEAPWHGVSKPREVGAMVHRMQGGRIRTEIGCAMFRRAAGNHRRAAE